MLAVQAVLPAELPLGETALRGTDLLKKNKNKKQTLRNHGWWPATCHVKKKSVTFPYTNSQEIQ